MESLTLDEWQKIVQICFWIVSGTVVVLTYLRARKSVLSTVNTEYQKRVMDRLQKLSEELYEEYDADSPSYWTKQNSVIEVTGKMNKDFLAHKELVLEEGEWLLGIPVSSLEMKFTKRINALKSDPFVPRNIKQMAIDLIENRLHVMHRIMMDYFQDYGDSLASGKVQPATRDYCFGMHNEIMKLLREQGCGIPEIEDEVHEIRVAIQRYFESFDPR